MNNIPSPLPKTSDDWLEHQIKAAGADVSPRVTPADVQANIASEHYFTAAQGVAGRNACADDPDGVVYLTTDSPLQLLTFCVLTLKNGFTVTGESACASPENFNAEIGRKVARENAVNKVWPLMGYALKEKLAGLQAADIADAKTEGFRSGYASAKRGDPAPISNGGDDFDLPAKACDLSGEGTCEACQ